LSNENEIFVPLS